MCKIPKENDYLLFNFMTGALLKIDEETKKKIENINLLKKEEIETLKENGFLIENFDEINYYKQ